MSGARGLAAAVSLAAGAWLAGCASTQLGAQWVDPQFVREPLRGAAILVVCEAVEPAIKLLCESQVSGQLLSLGARPLTDQRLVNPTPGREPPADQYLAAAQAAGAQAVLSVTLMADLSMPAAAPTFSIGIGGFGGTGGYRGGGIGGGVGVALPVGGTAGTTGLAGIGSLVDVASGRVIWSAKATTPAGADPTALIAEVTRVLVGAARQSGVL